MCSFNRYYIYYIILYYILLYYIILHYIILYCIILYYITLHYFILYIFWLWLTMIVSMLNITVIVYKCIELLFVHFVQFQQILYIYINIILYIYVCVMHVTYSWPCRACLTQLASIRFARRLPWAGHPFPAGCLARCWWNELRCTLYLIVIQWGYSMI